MWGLASYLPSGWGFNLKLSGSSDTRGLCSQWAGAPELFTIRFNMCARLCTGCRILWQAVTEFDPGFEALAKDNQVVFLKTKWFPPDMKICMSFSVDIGGPYVVLYSHPR
jgi:hypothetical protein